MPLFALPSMPNTYTLLLLLLITEEEGVVEEEHGILKKLFYFLLNFYICFAYPGNTEGGHPEGSRLVRSLPIVMAVLIEIRISTLF